MLSLSMGKFMLHMPLLHTHSTPNMVTTYMLYIYIHSVILVWDNPTTVLIYTRLAKSADGQRGEIHPEHIKWVAHCVQNDKRFDHNVLICDSSKCLIFCDCQHRLSKLRNRLRSLDNLCCQLAFL